MSNTRDKAQAFTKQLVGQMVGDDLLVQEGKEQEREADGEPSKPHRDQGDRQPQSDRASRRKGRAASRKG